MEKEKSYQERMNKTTDYKFDAIKKISKKWNQNFGLWIWL